MNASALKNSPQLLRDFLFYMETIRGRSPKTVEAYYTDLHTFFCFMKIYKGVCDSKLSTKEIDISDIDLEFIKSITLSDVYEYLNYAMSERENNAKTRARKVSSLRSFYKYLTAKANVLEENPIQELEIPGLKKSLPKYLSLEQSLELLSHVDSSAPKRDYCMVTLFLNCGIRLSELVGLNLPSIHLTARTMTVLGKGNKERLLYLNDACIRSLEEYLQERSQVKNIRIKMPCFYPVVGLVLPPAEYSKLSKDRWNKQDWRDKDFRRISYGIQQPPCSISKVAWISVCCSRCWAMLTLVQRKFIPTHLVNS